MNNIEPLLLRPAPKSRVGASVTGETFSGSFKIRQVNRFGFIQNSYFNPESETVQNPQQRDNQNRPFADVLSDTFDSFFG